MEKSPKGKGEKLANEILSSEKTLRKFEKIINAQGRKKSEFKNEKQTFRLIISILRMNDMK